MNREEITKLAREAGFVGMDGDHGALRRFAVLVAAAAKAEEREACAKVCDEEGLLWGQRYAAAIRARNQGCQPCNL